MTTGQGSDDLLEAFLRMERELDLFAAREKGIPFWEMLRYPTYTRIISGSGLQDYYLAGRPKIWSQLWKNLRFVARSLTFNNPFFLNTADLLVLSGVKRTQRNGKQHDIYTDPLLDLVGDRLSFRVIERPFGESVHKTPAEHGPVGYLDFIYAISMVRSWFLLPKLSQETDRLCAEASDRIEKMCGVRIDLHHDVRLFFARWHIELYLFSRLLRTLKPRALLVVVSAGNESFICAAKRERVPSLELQHGSPAPGKLNYDYPAGFSKDTFPDYFLSFGPFWSRHVHLPLPAARVLPIGFLHMNRLRARYSDVRRTRQILVLSQRTIGRYLAPFAVQLRNQVPADIEIIYKLHPEELGDWRQRYPELEKNGVRVVFERGADLYALFAASTWQVGVYSTALYEGIAFGCRTFVLRAPGWEAMRPLVKDGAARLVEQAADIAGVLAVDDGDPDKALTKDYFAEIGKEEIISCIENIISSGKV